MQVKMIVKDKEEYIISMPAIKINNGKLIGSIIFTSKFLYLATKNHHVDIEHKEVINRIGFVNDIIVFLDEKDELYYIKNLILETGSYDIVKVECTNKEIKDLMSAGDRSSIRCIEDGKKVYYHLMELENKIELGSKPISRAQYDRMCARSIFLDTYLKTNDFTINL